MAEENKSAAQSKLGELFVDIGSSGLGGLLKNLNSLSASFLLTKNAAQQFTKPIINMSQTAAQGVVGLDKIRSITGLTVDELQRLQVWTKLNNISFGDFVGQIQKAQQKIMDVRTGMAEAPAGLSKLGLTAFEFDPHDPIGFLNAIMSKVSQVDEVTGAALLRWLEFSEDLRYAWEQGNQVFDDRLILDEQELNNLRQQNSAWNTLKVTVDMAFKKWISQQEWLNKGLTETADNTDTVYEAINVLGTAVKNIGISFKWLYGILKKVWGVMKKIAELVGELKVAGSTGNLYKSKDWEELQKDPAKMHKYQELLKKQKQLQAELNKQIQENGKKQEQQQASASTNKRVHHTTSTYTPINKASNITPESSNNFGVRGSQLLSPQPIDYSSPSSVNSYNGVLPPVPAAATGNVNNNNISFEINQTITGDNAEQIAQASANAIDDASMNILQAQNQWAV